MNEGLGELRVSQTLFYHSDCLSLHRDEGDRDGRNRGGGNQSLH